MKAACGLVQQYRAWSLLQLRTSTARDGCASIVLTNVGAGILDAVLLNGLFFFVMGFRVRVSAPYEQDCNS